MKYLNKFHEKLHKESKEAQSSLKPINLEQAKRIADLAFSNPRPPSQPLSLRDLKRLNDLKIKVEKKLIQLKTKKLESVSKY